MRVLLIAAVVCAGVLLGYYLVHRVFDQTPDDQAPATTLGETRRIAAKMPSARSSVAPPASRLQRLRKRATVCLRQGHTFRVAFPAHQYRHQCRDCGAVRRVETHRLPAGVPLMSAPLLDVLTRTRRRLTPDGAWAKDAWARTVTSIAVDASAPDATCWCLVGALTLEARCAGGGGLLLALAAEAISQTIGLETSGLTLEGWNDAPGRTQSDVLGVLDLTIARLAAVQGAAA